jgi:F-type H+-transporting ATPase subunit epsilon
MAGIFNLQIVTPEREVFNGPVEMVSLPGMDGSFGVLRNHAPLIAALDAGVVSIFDPDGAEEKLAIGGGFFQVAKNQAMILADSAEFSHEIDLASAQELLNQAQSRTEGEVGEEFKEHREAAEKALKRARTRVKVASGR